MKKIKHWLKEILEAFKKRLYFWGASYFAYFAKKRLREWHPQVVVVTGSVGKTTAFKIIEAQLGEKAFYSHKSNSSYGIPFNILGIRGNDKFSPGEWLKRFWQAPWLVDKYPVPKERIYVVECDCDRPFEGDFLSKFLEPDVVIWLNVISTHAANFDRLVKKGKFKKVEEAIAYEFGFFVERAKKVVMVNGDSGLIGGQLARLDTQTRKRVKIYSWPEKDFLKKYELNKQGTVFDFVGAKITLPALLPKAAWLSVAASQKLCELYGVPFDKKFTKLKLPPGRSSVFEGIRRTTIIDSTYNSSPLAVREMLGVFTELKAKQKWVILGDMLELGAREEQEHQQLAEEIRKTPDLTRVVLFGARVKKYTAPKLEKYHIPVVVLESGEEVYKYLLDNLSGGEALLFKGSQGGMWEAIIEMLLLYPERDREKLPRRSPTWERRRQEYFKTMHWQISDEQIKSEVRMEMEKVPKKSLNKSLKTRKLSRGKIFIVPGWSYSLEKWRDLGLRLEVLGWEVKLLPVPGLTGEKLERAWTLDDYVMWLEKKLSRQKKAIVIGHSNGGRILIKYAAKLAKMDQKNGPESKLKKIILIDSAGLIDQRWYKKMKRKIGGGLSKLSGKLKENEKVRKLIYKVLRESDYLEATPVMRATMANLITVDLSEELKQVETPALLIWGKEDQQTPLFQGRKMVETMPKAQLVVVEAARHAPQFTHPNEVAAAIESFLDNDN